MFIFQVSDIRAVDSTEFTITLKATNNAAFVWLEAAGIAGQFSDNGFMLAAPNKTVTFFSQKSSTVDTLRISLKIQSLMDVYD